MHVYHGTSAAAAQRVSAAINVTLGGGELGRGFYAGENIALAAAWAQGKHQSNAKVVKIDIPDTEFVQLRVRAINQATYLLKHWQWLLSQKLTKTHLYNVDVVVAPFATIQFSYQYKFESAAAEAMLNNKSQRTIL